MWNVQPRPSTSSNSFGRTSSTPAKTASPAATSISPLPNTNLTPRQSSNTPAQRSTPVSTTPAPKQSSAQQQQAAPSPANSTPGRWRHPRMDEVIRRQSRTNFDSHNTLSIAVSAALIGGTFLVSWAQSRFLPIDIQLHIRPYTFYLYLILRTIFLATIALNVLPLLRKPDTCEDVPLTPHQRKLLGLPPMSRPATPQEEAQYVTPPRYTRSATPGGSGSSSLFVQASGSPLAGYGGGTGQAREGSPISGAGAANSPFGSASQRGSPYALSPLGAGIGADGRRLSYTAGGRGSPRSSGEFDRSFGAGVGGAPGTPPKGQHRASVGLNSKWLYEKGRTSPGWGTWGTGSVFN